MININSTITDSLTIDSEIHPSHDNPFKQDYLLTDLVAGELFQLNLTSENFDTYLQLIDRETGEIIGFNDDYNDSNYSLIFTPEMGINYLARVTTYSDNETGEYSLSFIEYDLDLEINSLTAPTTASIGQYLDISWTLNNLGTNASIIPRYVGFKIYLSDDEYLDNSDSYLSYYDTVLEEQNHAANTDIYLDNDIVPDDYYLLVVANPDNDLLETDYSNNTVAVPISIAEPDFDLDVTNFTAPDTITLGEGFDISWEVTNLGTNSINDYWSEYVYLSDDEYLDDSDIYLDSYTIDSINNPNHYGFYEDNILLDSALASQESYSVTQTIPASYFSSYYDVTLGEKYLILNTDKWDNIREIDETNNTSVVPITLAASENTYIDLNFSTSVSGYLSSSSQAIDSGYTKYLIQDYLLNDFVVGEPVQVNFYPGLYYPKLELINKETEEIIATKSSDYS